MALNKSFDIFPMIWLRTDALTGGADCDEASNGFPTRCGFLQIAQEGDALIGETSSLDKLSHLYPDIGEGMQQTVIWRTDFLCQELHDTDDTFRIFDREPERGM